METNEITIHAKLVAYVNEGMGYTTYVFENLEFNNDYDFQYIMCVCFPNWEGILPKNGDEGYVSLRYIQAGIDKWFNGKEFIPYNYTNVQFLKFIPIQPKQTKQALTLD